MSKKLFSLFLCLALLSVGLFAEWIPVHRDAADGSAPQIKVLASDNFHSIVEVTLPGFYRHEDRDSRLWKIALPEGALTEEIGKSALPTLSGILAVPGDVESVQLSHIDILSSHEFKGFQAYPFQKPTTDDESEGAFVKDEEHYASNELYPSACVQVEPVSVWRNLKVVLFRMTPIQARPASGALIAHGRVTFTLQYRKGRSETFASPMKAFDAMHQRMVLNYTPSGESRTAEKYLVIAKDDLASAVTPLVEWRKGQGYDASLVKLSSVGSTADQIKTYISNQYKNGVGYVVLVGDPANLPLYKWDNQYPSDCWYACVDGTDLFADLCVGRICALNATEVGTYIRKIKAYENFQSNGNDWGVRSLLITHKEGAPGKYEGCVEELKKASYQYKVLFTTLHGSVSGNDNTDIRNAIANGTGFVTYRGHGSETSWSGWNGSSFTTSDMRTLNNTVYPVFYSIACSNAALDSANETFAESCVKNANGAGSAFLGATRPSYTVPNHDFCKLLHVASFGQGISNVGDIVNYANAELLKKYGTSSYAAANVKMYLLLGDPAQQINVVK